MLIRFLEFAVLSTAVSGLSTKVDLDYATFQGEKDLLTNTTSFLGMPFAVAGRLENPRLIGPQDNLTGVQDATNYGPACPQHELVASPLETGNEKVGELLGLAEALLLPNITHQAEDCLNINVQVPKGIKDTSKLPVLMWIHGGGFELGSSASLGSGTTALPGLIYQVCSPFSYLCVLTNSADLYEGCQFGSTQYRNGPASRFCVGQLPLELFRESRVKGGHRCRHRKPIPEGPGCRL